MTKGFVQTGEYFSQKLKCNILVTKQVLSIAINHESKDKSYDRFNAQLISRNDISLNDVMTLWDEMREKDPEELKAIRKNIGKPIPVAHEEAQPTTAAFVPSHAKGNPWKNPNGKISEDGFVDVLNISVATKIPFTRLPSIGDLTGEKYMAIPPYAELEAGYADFVAKKANAETEVELAGNSR